MAPAGIHEAPVVLEQYNVDSKAPGRAQQARRPVADKVARAYPGPCPNLGIITTDSDVYTKASVLLEGEQNYALPFEGSEQYAAPCTPQSFSLSLVSLEPLKPPDCDAEDLEKSGGAWEATRAIPGPTKYTASVELVGTAEGAVAAEPEALEPGVESKDGSRYEHDTMAGRVAQVNVPTGERVLGVP